MIEHFVLLFHIGSLRPDTFILELTLGSVSHEN